MGQGSVIETIRAWLRLHRKRVMIGAVLACLGIGLWIWLSPGKDSAQNPDTALPPPKPPVGAFGLEKGKDGETRYGMQTADGRVGLLSGSIRIADMPYGLPLYPRAKVLDSSKLEGVSAADTGIQVNFVTTDSRKRVLDFYRREIAMARLEPYADMQAGNVDVLSAGYPGGRDGGFQLTVRTGGKGESIATLSTGFGQRYKPEPRPSIDDMLLLESNSAQP